MKRVTIKDVARVAGVSRQTVSRAMNDKGEISPDTKARVMDAIEQLGYQPNRAAQSMVTRRTRLIGVVIGDISNPFFPEVTRGVQDIAINNQYNVLLCNADGDVDVEMAALESLAAQGADGIVLFSHHISDDAFKTFADSFGKPIVLINRYFEHPNVSLIMVNNENGAEKVVDYFSDHGHTAIGMLTNADDHVSQRRRMKGYREALSRLNLGPNDDWIARTQPSLVGGYDATRELLTSHPEITALFTYNDLMAIGALRACEEMGLHVPDDIEIIGFDNIMMASMVTPALSSVHVDKYHIGETAMSRLLDMMDSAETPLPIIRMDVSLKLRESTRASVGRISTTQIIA